MRHLSGLIGRDPSSPLAGSPGSVPSSLASHPTGMALHRTICQVFTLNRAERCRAAQRHSITGYRQAGQGKARQKEKEEE